MSFRHSGPPKNPALPDSLASAEISGPRRLTAKFDPLQKPATSCLARVLRNGTIERVLAMSDVELGLQSLLGNRPPPTRQLDR
jgi:hypothetical protein